MKRIIFLLVLVFILFQAPAASAQIVDVDKQVVIVEERELIKLAGEEKFTNLIEILKMLVQTKTSSGVNKIVLDQISILDFKYSSLEKIKIYYYLR